MPSSDSWILQVTGPSSQTYQISQLKLWNHILIHQSGFIPNSKFHYHFWYSNSKQKCQVKYSWKSRNCLESDRSGFGSKPYYQLIQWRWQVTLPLQAWFPHLKTWGVPFTSPIKCEKSTVPSAWDIGSTWSLEAIFKSSETERKTEQLKISKLEEKSKCLNPMYNLRRLGFPQLYTWS